MERMAAARGDARADADIDARRAAVIARDLRVQGVDALQNDQLAGPPAQCAAIEDTDAVFEVIARQLHLLARQQLAELLLEKRHVDARRALEVQLVAAEKLQLPLRERAEIVVHGERVRLHAAAVQLPLDEQGGRRLAGAGRPRQQHGRALLRMGGDEIGRADDLLFIKSAVMLQHRGGVLRKQGAELIGRHRAFLLWVPEKPGRVSFQYSTTRGKMLTDF